MEITVKSDSEVFESHRDVSLGEVVDLAETLLVSIAERNGVVEAEAVHECKNEIARNFMKLVNEISDSRAECLFHLVAVASDMLVTAFENIERWKFEAELEEM